MRAWTVLWLLLCCQMLRADTLSLEGVLKAALENHPKVRGTRLLQGVAEARITEKEGAFDPNLFLGTDLLRYNSPSAPGKAKLANDHVLGLQIQDVAGWKLISGYRLNRGEVKSHDSLTGESGEFFLEFKLPLLRGAGIHPKQTELEQARVQRKMASALAAAVRLEVLLAASLAYWDWCAACTEMLLVERNLRLAETRLGQVRERVKAGDLARIDDAEAEQELARRRETMERAKRAVQKSALKLSLYLWGSDGQVSSLPQPGQAVLAFPAELSQPALGRAPGGASLPEVSPEHLARAEVAALALRPELHQLEFQRDSVQLERALAENDALPILDLTLGPGLDTGREGIGLTYKVGLELIVPLANRGPDGRLLAARLKSDKLSLEQVLEIQRILTEVRDAASLVSTSRDRLTPALESLRLALRLEEAERVKYSLGDSTLFLVNQRERASLLEAQKLVEIWTEAQKGLALLEAACGRL